MGATSVKRDRIHTLTCGVVLLSNLKRMTQRAWYDFVLLPQLVKAEPWGPMCVFSTLIIFLQ